jgi:cytosine/adenosine deaminase-related metal-dependent hydrolase
LTDGLPAPTTGGERVLLSADWVLPISAPPIVDGAVLVADGVIVAVGPFSELRARYPEEAAREFPGCVLLPGLVNTHTHLRFSAFRGFAPSCGFGEWMLRLLVAQRKLDSDDYAASALWGAYECARSGVTSIADTSQEGWTVGRAARAAGLRARVYLELFGLDDDQLPTAMERLEAGLTQSAGESGLTGPAGRLPGAVGGAAGTGLVVEWGISPHAPYTVSARLYREAARFARRAGLRLATHVAESPAEVKLLARGTSAISRAYKAAHLWKGQRWTPPGMSPLQYVAQMGVLGPDTLVVHAAQVDGDDIATLAGSGAAVAHCPRSNRRLRCGAAPVAEMMAAGVTVGLGTDSLASNDSLDLFAEMRAALAMSRERAAIAAATTGPGVSPTKGAGAPPAALATADVLRMATLEGARALGWDYLIGSLESGKRADIIAVRLPGARPPAVPDPTAGLVEAATAEDVRMTMVDGVVIFEGGDIPSEAARGLKTARAKLGLRA